MLSWCGNLAHLCHLCTGTRYEIQWLHALLIISTVIVLDVLCDSGFDPWSDAAAFGMISRDSTTAHGSERHPRFPGPVTTPVKPSAWKNLPSAARKRSSQCSWNPWAERRDTYGTQETSTEGNWHKRHWNRTVAITSEWEIHFSKEHP